MNVIHQIFYAWSDSSLLSGRGMGPVAASLPRPRLQEWDRVLRERVWAPWSGQSDEAGFVFVESELGGALIRKRPKKAPDGRDGSVAHVLLAAELSVDAALGLHAWDGWADPPDDGTEPAALPWAELAAVAVAGLEDLRSRARRVPAPLLADLVAGVLSHVREAVTVIRPPAPSAELLCGLIDLIGEAGRRPWTYSTYEASDTGTGALRIVFLQTLPPPSMEAVSRRRLRPGDGDPDPGLRPFAKALAASYARDGLAVIDRLRPAEPLVDDGDLRAWADTAQFVPGVLADLPGLTGLRLTDEQVRSLCAPGAMRRVEEHADALTGRALAETLDADLPSAVRGALARVAMRRLATGADDETLLGALAAVRPLPPDLLDAVPRPTGARSFARLAHVTRRLMADESRRKILLAAATVLPTAHLISGLDALAAADPVAAGVLYGVLCGRPPLLRRDLDEFLARDLLGAAIRRLAGEDPALEARMLTRLLAALLGENVTGPRFAEWLSSTVGPSPAALYAAAQVTRDGRALAAIGRAARRGFYARYGLPAPPDPSGLDHAPRAAVPTGWRRWFIRGEAR